MTTETLGQALSKTLNDFGFGGHILAVTADVDDPFELTVWRPIYNSRGQICITRDGDDVIAVRVAETVHVHHRERSL